MVKERGDGGRELGRSLIPFSRRRSQPRVSPSEGKKKKTSTAVDPSPSSRSQLTSHPFPSALTGGSTIVAFPPSRAPTSLSRSCQPRTNLVGSARSLKWRALVMEWALLRGKGVRGRRRRRSRSSEGRKEEKVSFGLPPLDFEKARFSFTMSLIHIIKARCVTRG